MKTNYSHILSNRLFAGVAEADIQGMLTCLGAYEKTYHPQDVILHEGDEIHFVGIVLQGSVQIMKHDYAGHALLLAEIAAGDLFAEVFACAGLSRSPVSIVSGEDSEILFFDYRNMISTCQATCAFHQKLIANMLTIIAHKTLYLNKRIDIISKRTLRDKLLAYLHEQSEGKSRFTISLNREQLANFLCADRSAVSNELSKMKKDGLIDYWKHEFQFLR